ncbi:MAG: hypothetical protein ACI86M_003597 [Saprospiraceae bacterium]|jgi:hypothetical protein
MGSLTFYSWAININTTLRLDSTAKLYTIISTNFIDAVDLNLRLYWENDPTEVIRTLNYFTGPR